ncbi:MAG TPA: hypothetical protein VMF08_20545 [Candidatus Sulfotelmatobacter sp.]|nr:hypothetical protein [Candidatus Sulfotelmatobacter sp.]
MKDNISPEGTAELVEKCPSMEWTRGISAVPSGLVISGNRNPALKRRAISNYPYGIEETERYDYRGRCLSRRYVISRLLFSLFFMLCLAGVITRLQAQTTYSTTTVADAFLATGSASNPDGYVSGENFGAAGTMAVAPANAIKGEFQSVARFDFSGAVPVFNTAYGTNGWTVTGVSLTLTSNYGVSNVQPNNAIFNIISGGNFVIAWLSDNDWAEGTGTPNLPTTDGVTFDSLPELLSGPTNILCTNTYTPPGNNIPITYQLPLDTNIVAEIESGGQATFLFYAADTNISYLFNSKEYGRGNDPLINVTASPFLEIVSGNFTNGVFHLTAQGGAGFQYQVQASTNLATANWETIGTVTADSNGVMEFDDLTATNHERFYRLAP